MKSRIQKYKAIFCCAWAFMGNLALAQDDIIFTIDDTPVHSEEFQYVYKKNNLNNEKAFTKSDIDDYLELFINFKLKVTEARNLGYDTTKAYSDELAQYEDQLTKPYLTEKEVTEGLISEAFDRMQYEVDASHLLIVAGPEASPEDTLKAYMQIQKIYEMALINPKFSDLVVKYSEEPMVQTTKGHLGYFTALQMVYPFENSAYATPVNEVSKPFRTRFGYHILKIHDKRPSNGKVQISHLMLRFNESMSSEDSMTVRNKIFELYDQAISGYDWDQLCKEHSEDLNTKNRGGNLSPFGVGEMIPSIAEPAFALSKIGEISDPIMTEYGWHILKLNERIPLPGFEDYEAQLRRRIERDSRSDKSRETLIKRLKKENKYVENQEAKLAIQAYTDSSTFSGNWTPPFTSEPIPIFTIADSSYTSGQFVNFVNASYGKAGTGHPSVRINRLYNLFAEEKLIEYEKSHLEEKYEDYRYLMKEYREGILLFEIMEDEVWTKSGIDSVGILQFYNDNLANYKVKESGSIITFESANGQDRQKMIEKLSAWVGDTTLGFDSVSNILQKEYPDEQIRSFKSIEKGDVGWNDYIKKGKGVYESQSGEIHIVFDYKPAKTSELNEIKGLVISDYQDLLDRKWVTDLRSKYKVRINKKELNKLYKSLVP